MAEWRRNSNAASKQQQFVDNSKTPSQSRKNEPSATALSNSGALAKGFEEEEKVLQQRRLPASYYPDYDSYEEEIKDSLETPHSSHVLAAGRQHSNDILGEVFSD